MQYVEGDGAGAEQLRVSVRLPNGQVMDLDSSAAGGGAGGQTIDVEWKSVDDK